nr:fasciclin domain-containing protein [Alteromonas sp. PRIM-21]
MAKDVSALSDATTVEGSKFMVSTTMYKVMINDAQVIKADVMTSNGVIHVIDTVLLPEDVKTSL